MEKVTNWVVTYIDEDDMLITHKVQQKERPFIDDNNWLQVGQVGTNANHIRNIKIMEVK
ncbi:hypothetical protein [Lapidilactobacillus bayanensis]|uniref:hypothetical protein n=1 Tax=Lapidilactobacillus bayanensis TaxID=2485998 RepID=UPI0013DE62D0|nr:hypothetical protein [Lapidilactobacillus bayanensis]